MSTACSLASYFYLHLQCPPPHARAAGLCRRCAWSPPQRRRPRNPRPRAVVAAEARPRTPHPALAAPHPHTRPHSRVDFRFGSAAAQCGCRRAEMPAPPLADAVFANAIPKARFVSDESFAAAVISTRRPALGFNHLGFLLIGSRHPSRSGKPRQLRPRHPAIGIFTEGGRRRVRCCCLLRTPAPA